MPTRLSYVYHIELLSLPLFRNEFCSVSTSPDGHRLLFEQTLKCCVTPPGHVNAYPQYNKVSEVAYTTRRYRSNNSRSFFGI